MGTQVAQSWLPVGSWPGPSCDNCNALKRVQGSLWPETVRAQAWGTLLQDTWHGQAGHWQQVGMRL